MLCIWLLLLITLGVSKIVLKPKPKEISKEIPKVEITQEVKNEAAKPQIKKPSPVVKPTAPKVSYLMPAWKWQIVAIIKKYPWDWRIASAIFIAESGLNPAALGDGGSSCGIAQLHPCPTTINWKDPEQNIAYAYKYKYLPSGWYPWSVYKSGTYLKYLYLFK